MIDEISRRGLLKAIGVGGVAGGGVASRQLDGVWGGGSYFPERPVWETPQGIQVYYDYRDWDRSYQPPGAGGLQEVRQYLFHHESVLQYWGGDWNTTTQRWDYHFSAVTLGMAFRQLGNYTTLGGVNAWADSDDVPRAAHLYNGNQSLTVETDRSYPAIDGDDPYFNVLTDDVADSALFEEVDGESGLVDATGSEDVLVDENLDEIEYESDDQSYLASGLGAILGVGALASPDPFTTFFLGSASVAISAASVVDHLLSSDVTYDVVDSRSQFQRTVPHDGLTNGVLHGGTFVVSADPGDSFTVDVSSQAGFADSGWDLRWWSHPAHDNDEVVTSWEIRIPGNPRPDDAGRSPDRQPSLVDTAVSPSAYSGSLPTPTESESPTPAEGRTPTERPMRTPTESDASTTTPTETETPTPTDVNQSPTAGISISPSSPAAGETVTFDGADSSDPDGDALDYRWEVRTGSTGVAVDNSPSFSTSLEAGDYEVTLEVSDEHGSSDVATATFTVSGSFQVGIDKREIQGGWFELTAQPEGGVTPISYEWRIVDTRNGDEWPRSGRQVEWSGNSGQYRVYLTATDDSGAVAEDQGSLYVV